MQQHEFHVLSSVFFGNKCLIIISIELSGNQFAIAIETLPVLDVSALIFPVFPW
jgi:hypothetical protein